MPSTDLPAEEAFVAFFAGAEPTLRRALIAAYGPTGREAAADALAYGWEHWERVGSMHDPIGYLYRVGQSRMRWYRRRPRAVAPPDPAPEPHLDPGLDTALAKLTRPQRVAVVLCHGFGLTHREVAALLGVAPSTVQNHVERGIAKLRSRLEVSEDA
ncbi:MAG: hypothetical protein QOE35_1749 [Actinomycetota bacterium]|jgi:RNA polymerase sigma factor (sigma-70 family)